jgi:3',5'-cyclic AMP phosphodiesterase CpdA
VPARFSYIHLSDFHFCAQPTRTNALSLIKRNTRGLIDTIATIQSLRSHAQDFGVLSLARPASYIPAITSGVAQFCYQHAGTVDGIIISGDLATTGLGSDLGVAHAFVDEAPAKNGFTSETARPTLQASRRPIYVIPGNHDRYANNYAVTNSRTFDLTFGSYLNKFNGYVGHWVRRKQGRHIGFVFADFTLRTRSDASSRMHVFGQGRVYQDVLADLKARTFQLRADYPDIALNWLVHFAPYDCGSFLELIDWQNIVSAAAAAGVTATLCGHTHAQYKIQVGNHTIYCAGSAGCADSETTSTVHILRFDIDTSVSVRRENYKWNNRELEFERQPDD